MSRLPAWLHWSAALLWALFLWTLSAKPATGGPRSQAWTFVWNGGHVAAYFVLAFLLWLALSGTLRSLVARGWAAGLGGGVYGALDEWHQSYVPGRDCSGWDMASDVLGAFLAALSLLWLEGLVPLRWIALLVLTALGSVAAATWAPF